MTDENKKEAVDFFVRRLRKERQVAGIYYSTERFISVCTVIDGADKTLEDKIKILKEEARNRFRGTQIEVNVIYANGRRLYSIAPPNVSMAYERK